MSRLRKCEHNACKCLVDGADPFCSPHCEQRSDIGDSNACACGHDDCSTSADIPLDGGLLPA